MNEDRLKVIEVAKKYLEQSELKGNVFKTDTELGRRLKESGHKDGEAWCSYFAESVFCEAYPEKAKSLRTMFDGSAVTTLKKFRQMGYTILAEPRAGALVIWQRYNKGVASWQGHAGIVIEVLPGGSFLTIEGNTNVAGSPEGTSVKIKTRTRKKFITGLNILGFVLPVG
jgi:hypothetical protein